MVPIFMWTGAIGLIFVFQPVPLSVGVTINHDTVAIYIFALLNNFALIIIFHFNKYPMILLIGYTLWWTSCFRHTGNKPTPLTQQNGSKMHFLKSEIFANRQRMGGADAGGKYIWEPMGKIGISNSICQWGGKEVLMQRSSLSPTDEDVVESGSRPAFCQAIVR